VRSRQALAQIGDTGRQALAEMSHLLGVLRTDEEAPALAPAPGVAEIAQLVSQAREAGMSVSYTMEGAFRPLPIGLSMAAYRMVQEALTNIRKHAAPGAPAQVTLCYGRDELLVRVADDGRGPAGRPSSLPRYGPARTVGTVRPDGDGGQGLTGMRERAVIYGGTVQAGPRPGGGFEVAARLPLPAAAPPADAMPAGATPAGPPHAGHPTSRDAG
jgi:signal transduction histidine kinase